jgi:hypothetical protein
MKNKIVLNELGDKGRYIDLSGYANDVTITGRHQGNRIVISNASGKVLRFDTVQIHCTRTEPDGDALVFDGALTDCKIIGTGCHIEHGGLTFWGKLENVTIAGLDIYHANAGIRASGDFPNRNVLIKDCSIISAKREGIYLGPSYLQKEKSTGLEITENYILCSGWDAIQVNGVCKIYGNRIHYPATLKTPNQDYAITIQAGSVAFVWSNYIHSAEKRIQALDCRYFDHEPKN